MAFRLDVLGSLSKKIRKPKTELPESENTPNTTIPSPEPVETSGAGVPPETAISEQPDQADPVPVSEPVPEQPVQEPSAPAPEPHPAQESGSPEVASSPIPVTATPDPTVATPSDEEAGAVTFTVPWPVLSSPSETTSAEPAAPEPVTETPVPAPEVPVSTAPPASDLTTAPSSPVVVPEPVQSSVPEPVQAPAPGPVAQPGVPVPAPVTAPAEASPVPAVPSSTPPSEAVPAAETPKPKPARPKVKLITKEEQEEFRLLDIDPTPKARRKPVYSGERALSRSQSDPELLGEKVPEPDIWEEEPAWEDEVPEPEPTKPEPDIWESEEDSQWEPEEPEPQPAPKRPEPRYVSYEEEPVYERKPAPKPVHSRPKQVVYEEEIPEEEPVYHKVPEPVRPRRKPVTYEEEDVPEEEPVYRKVPEPVRARPRRIAYTEEEIPEEEPEYELRPERKQVQVRPKRIEYEEEVYDEGPEEEEQYEPPVRSVKQRPRAPEPSPIRVPPREPAPRKKSESEIQSERRAGGRGIITFNDAGLGTGLGSDPFADLGRDRRSDTSHASAIRTPARKSAISSPSKTTRFREESSLGVRVSRDSDVEYDVPLKTGTKTERFSDEEGLGQYHDIDATPEQPGRKRMGVKTEYFPEDEEQETPVREEPDEAGISFSTKPSLMGADRISDSKGKKKIGKFYEVEDLKRDPDYSDE